MQIALERQILDDSSFDLNNGYNGDNKFINPGVDDFNMAGVNSIKSDGTDDMSDDGTHDVPNESTGDVNDAASSFSGGQRYTGFQRQTTKLNATQTTSLIRIIQQYKSGLLNINQAVSIMQSMGLDETFARKLLEDEEKVKDVLG